MQTLGPLSDGGGDPTLLVRRGHFWRASHTPDGPVTLHLRSVDAVTVEAEAWGSGSQWMLDQVDHFVGARDDLSGFDADRHPTVARSQRRHPGLRIARSGLVQDFLVQAVLGQKVTGVQAKRAWRALVRQHGHEAPGPSEPMLRLPPTMAEVGGLSYWMLHPMGVEQRRAETIIRAARRIDRLQEAATMPAEAAMRRLTALPGIGPWTAGLVRRLCFGDPDAVEVGDYHLPDMVSWTLAGEPRGTDARMLELLAPFEGHRGRALQLLKVGGSGKPKYGPRMTIHAVEDL